MSLPPLLKHIYNYGTEEVVRRGKKIFLTGGVQLMQADTLIKQAEFKVRNDVYQNTYRVLINKYNDPRSMSVRCQCPYNMGEICRHEVAALFQLNDLLNTQGLEHGEICYNQKHTVVRMRQIDPTQIKLYSSENIFRKAEAIISNKKIKIFSAKDEKVEAEVTEEGQEHMVIIGRNEERSFDTSCDCNETDHALCVHKTALLLQLQKTRGPGYFDTIRNFDLQKNRLLSLYGYSLTDELEGKFEFQLADGKLTMKVLDPAIKKVNASPYATAVAMARAQTEVEVAESEKLGQYHAGIVINLNQELYPYFSLDLISGEASEEGDRFVDLVKKVDLGKYVVADNFQAQERELIPVIRKFHETEIAKYIKRNAPFGEFMDAVYQPGTTISDESRELIREYLHPKLVRFWESLAHRKRTFLLPNRKGFKTSNLKPVTISAEPAILEMEVLPAGKQVEVKSFVRIGTNRIPLEKNTIESGLLFIYENVAYTFRQQPDAAMADKLLTQGPWKIEQADWQHTLENELLPMSKQYNIHFHPKLLKEESGILPKMRLYMQEQGEFFMLTPIFVYDKHEAQWNEDMSMFVQQNGKVVLIHRNKDAEQDWLNRLKTLSAHFVVRTQERYFMLKAKEAFKKNWFFSFFESMKEWDVEMLGYENLRQFKVSRHKPETRLQLSSGIDWFDANVEIVFGDQIVQIQDVKKALNAKHNYVKLGDGSVGLLPEEWLQRYSLLFKMSEEKGGKLRLSKYNFSIIDELYDYIDDEALRNELMEKKERLLNMNPEDTNHYEVPELLQPILRPYQAAGFRWLAYLNEIRWGGVLADDMGLGKTVQTLAFVQYYQQRNPNCKILVVCPTSLVYNWQNEIKKFTPDLQFLIHHGTQRASKISAFDPYHIIITTYGTLRSDIQMLMQLEFDYAILDESQAIKNPTSKVAKAAQLLHCKNRLCLSGTPMQNNTYDIYAQMHFLNPGMLGGMDFFKQEFANPIDKFAEDETKQHLRKLIYPFLLRRTKEQVARDLPEKTESVLFCEMNPEQRKIYEAFRNTYRSRILGLIDEQGVDRSQLTILQGLMKLRQICDSPAILNEDSEYENHSVKLDELTREITENVGDHKVLIFSQFLGMLGLIRERLKNLNIPFEYFDGGTSTSEREKAIRNFQGNDNCRVFLISLKAGGVGLNLTAADYVYIVDPWWNPAIEQQAIDRTHRIGQTKNILAYRMICKDTVEEKILELQEKKKSLVKDIISDDQGFIKKLTREDVMYLFS